METGGFRKRRGDGRFSGRGFLESCAGGEDVHYRPTREILERLAIILYSSVWIVFFRLLRWLEIYPRCIPSTYGTTLPLGVGVLNRVPVRKTRCVARTSQPAYAGGISSMSWTGSVRARLLYVGRGSRLLNWNGSTAEEQVDTGGHADDRQQGTRPGASWWMWREQTRSSLPVAARCSDGEKIVVNSEVVV